MINCAIEMKPNKSLDDLKNNEEVTDFEEALSVLGLGSYNIKCCMIQAFILISAMMEVTGYSYVLLAAKCDLDMTDPQRGLIASLPYLAFILSSFGWGYIADTMGRKRAIIYSSLAGGGLGILAGFMPEVITFTTVKFLGSLCTACTSTTPYAVIGEIVPKQHRDLMLSFTNAQQILGTAVSPMIAWGFLLLDIEIGFGLYYFRPWRLLTIVYSSLLILCACLMHFVPESPKYLMSQGRHDEALHVLKIIFARNTGKPENNYPIKNIMLFEDNNRNKSSFLESLKTQSLPLLRPPYLRWLALNGILLFALYGVLNGLSMWIPDILNQVLSGNSNGRTACQVIASRLNKTIHGQKKCDNTLDKKPIITRSIINVFGAGIALAISITVKFIGKKKLLLTIYLLLGTFCILSNVVTQELIFSSFLSVSQLIVVCVGPINSYAIEKFPTQLSMWFLDPLVTEDDEIA